MDLVRYRSIFLSLYIFQARQSVVFSFFSRSVCVSLLVFMSPIRKPQLGSTFLLTNWLAGTREMDGVKASMVYQYGHPALLLTMWIPWVALTLVWSDILVWVSSGGGIPEVSPKYSTLIRSLAEKCIVYMPLVQNSSFSFHFSFAHIEGGKVRRDNALQWHSLSKIRSYSSITYERYSPLVSSCISKDDATKLVMYLCAREQTWFAVGFADDVKWALDWIRCSFSVVAYLVASEHTMDVKKDSSR